MQADERSQRNVPKKKNLKKERKNEKTQADKRRLLLPLCAITGIGHYLITRPTAGAGVGGNQKPGHVST